MKRLGVWQHCKRIETYDHDYPNVGEKIHVNWIPFVIEIRIHRFRQLNSKFKSLRVIPGLSSDCWPFQLKNNRSIFEFKRNYALYSRVSTKYRVTALPVSILNIGSSCTRKNWNVDHKLILSMIIFQYFRMKLNRSNARSSKWSVDCSFITTKERF